MKQEKSKIDKTEGKSPVQMPGQWTVFLFPLITITVISVLIYYRALTAGFILDDYSQVLKNHVIRDLGRIPEVFLRSAWVFEGAPPTSNYYRPMLNLIYMFTYYFFGYQAWGYHLVNVLFHAGNAALVFLIMTKLTGRQADNLAGQQMGNPVSALFSPPFIAALLFASHPVNTEAVTWVAGVSDVTLAFFYLLSFYLYIISRGIYSRYYVLSIIAFLLAILCKEPGLTLPGILILYDYAFGKKKVWSRDSLKNYAVYIFAVCGYFALRLNALGGLSPFKSVAKLSNVQYGINVFPIFAQYLYKLILPINLNFWHTYRPITSLVSREGILSLLAAAIFICCLIVSLKKNRVMFISLMLIATTLAPALYLKGIVGKLFSERYLYLPSVGFAIFLSALLVRRKPGRSTVKTGLAIAFTGLIVIYSFGTISRNAAWKDEYSLFADTVKKSPNSVVPRLELGNALLLKGRLDEAIEQFNAALTMEPNLYVIHHHLGLALAGKNRLYEAIEQYQVAINLNPGRPQIYEDLGRALAKAGFRDLAIKNLETAVQMRPGSSVYNLLGVMYALQGQLDKAIANFRAAVSLDPSQTIYKRNLAEAGKIKESLLGGKSHAPDYRWEYEERTLTDADIFSFVW
jgi:tetratricopeptide (TPR) repeat protein